MNACVLHISVFIHFFFRLLASFGMVSVCLRNDYGTFFFDFCYKYAILFEYFVIIKKTSAIFLLQFMFSSIAKYLTKKCAIDKASNSSLIPFARIKNTWP